MTATASANTAPAASRDPVVRFQDVHKTYEMGNSIVRALDGVTHDFQRGTFWAILGPSGSGKSTMLNLLGCLDRPTNGQCLIDGVDVNTLNDDRLSELRLRRLGFIFQSFNLIQQLTVAENIALPLSYLDWDPRQAYNRAADLADLVGLGDRLGHRPNELSGGQQQRVAIARSLANDPPLLLADEPTGNLDSATTAQIMTILCDLHAQGRTIIMVTHEPEIAENASHQMHMRDGRIERIEGP